MFVLWGRGKREIQQAPGFSRQPAITCWLLSMAQREQANRLNVQAESFCVFLRVLEREVALGACTHGKELRPVSSIPGAG